LVENTETKRPFARPTYKWEDYIRMYLKETGWEFVEWIHLAQVKGQWKVPENTVMNLPVHNSLTI
jgi:hypothetical protein